MVWISLFKGNSKSFKKCLVENICADELAIITTTTFGVCSGDNIEAISWSNIGVSLLEENTLTFEQRLKTHDLVTGEVNLIQAREQHHDEVLEQQDHQTIQFHR